MTGEGRRGGALTLLCVAQFVDVLDVNVVIVALPTIQRALRFSDAELQWVVSAYVLFFAGFLLLAGRLADLYGRRRLFMVGLGLFAAASLAAGLAPSSAVLVVARAAQGLGAALASPAALSSITTIFRDGPERDRAVGVWTAVAAAGGAAGLVLGGALADLLGWRWVFLVNVPIGAVGLALSPILLPETRDPSAPRKLDVGGAVSATGGLVLLVYGLTRAEESGLGSPGTLAALALALALIAAFVLVEARVAHPLVPLRVFRSRDLTGAVLVGLANTAATGPPAVLLTVYLQRVLGLSPTATGLVFLPLSLAAVAGSLAGSRLTSRVGPRAAAVSGLLVIAASTLLLLGISPGGGLALVLASNVLVGAGLGVSAVASTSVGTGAVGGGERGLASGLLNSAAQVGTALGLAALVALAAARTDALARAGGISAEALVGGYRWAFLVGASVAATGALLALLTIGGRVRDG